MFVIFVRSCMSILRVTYTCMFVATLDFITIPTIFKYVSKRYHHVFCDRYTFIIN